MRASIRTMAVFTHINIRSSGDDERKIVTIDSTMEGKDQISQLLAKLESKVGVSGTKVRIKKMKASS